MIDPKTLRVGNWVEPYIYTMGFGDGKDGVRPLSHRQMTAEWLVIIEKSKISEGQYLATCNPVKLTYNILEKCGFKNINTEHCESFVLFPLHIEMIPDGTIEVRFMVHPIVKEMDTYYIGPLESLHQLQNLYFALTNQELIYKP